MIDLAVQLIEKKSGPFNPTKFQDHYATALRELVQDKLKGHKIIAPHEDARPKGSNVVDLMEALKRSIGEPAPAKTKAPRGGPPALSRSGPVRQVPAYPPRSLATPVSAISIDHLQDRRLADGRLTADDRAHVA